MTSDDAARSVVVFVQPGVLRTLMVILGLLVPLFLPSVAQACTCAFPTITDKLEVASSVFRGYVTSASLGDGEIEFVVQVDEVLMGDAGREMRLYTKDDHAACGMGSVAVGSEYLVVVRSGPFVSSCSGTQRLLYQSRDAVLTEYRTAISALR